MKPDTFFDNFGLLADAPNGVQKLREIILQLAVQGKLVPQDPKDEPASVLLEKIKAEKKRLIEEGKIRKQKPTLEIKEEEKLFVLPDEWQWCRLGDLGAIFNGNSLNSRQKTSYSKVTNGLPYISTKHVGYGTLQIDYSGEIKIPLNEPKFKIAHKNSILICSEGGSAGRKIGLIDRDICFGNKLLANETFSGVISKFVFYMYQSPFFLLSFKAKMTGIIGGISINNFLNLVIPLPPSAEQKRIVAKVDELIALCDELEARKQKVSIKSIQLNDASIHKLLTGRESTKFSKHWQRICDNFSLLYSKPENVAKLRQAILQLAVQGKLAPQDPKDEPASVFLEKIKAKKEQLIKEGKIKKVKPLPPIKPDDLPFMVPPSWNWTRFGEVASISTNLVKPKDFPNYPHIAPDSIKKETGKLLNYRIVAEDEIISNKHRFFQGQILYSKIRPNLSKAVIADFEGLCSADMYPITSFIYTRYLHHYILSKTFFSLATKKDTRVAIPKINQKELNLVLVPLPPHSEQKRIVAKINQLMTLCDELETRLLQSQTDCDRLMEAAVAKILAA